LNGIEGFECSNGYWNTDPDNSSARARIRSARISVIVTDYCLPAFREMLKRLIKTGLAIGVGQGLNIAQQLLLPPAFLHFYGVELYSSWLIMTAGIAHLNTLDFGLQTYIVNRLGMLYHTGRQEEFRRVQSIGLRLVVGTVLAATLLLLPLLFLPVESWLKLGLPAFEARGTLLLLAFGILAQIVFGQVAGVFRAIGLAHRNQHWANAQRVLNVGAMLGLIACRVSFIWLAAVPFLIGLAMFAIVLNDLRRRAPHGCPTVRQWDAVEARNMVKPSLFFGLGVLNNFLLFEVPLLILQFTGGPLAVVTFATTRTLFSAGRQLLTPIQYSLIPEITRLHAVNDRATLARVYRFAEAIALWGGLTLNVTLGLASGVILALWLRGQVSPAPQFIALMAVVAVATVYRESKFLFQIATNHHERNSLLSWFSYVGMGVAGWFLSRSFGASGMAAAWLLSELIIIMFLVRENTRLLGRNVSWSPLLCLGGLAALYLLLQTGLGWFVAAGKVTQALLAGTAGLLAGFIGLFTIGRELLPLLQRLYGRIHLQKGAAL
jgi:O-antigen/teichoic acid export membrane protein